MGHLVVMQTLMCNRRWPLIVILVLAVIVRVAGVYITRSQPPSPDAVEDYLPIANNLLDGNGFLNGNDTPDIVRGPVYPLIIALAQVAARDSLLAIKLLQIILDLVTTILIFDLARRLTTPLVGIAAAGIYAVHPPVIYACTLIGPETAFACVMTLSVSLYVRGISDGNYDDRSKSSLCFSSGVALGATTLCRATPMLLLPLWLLVLIVHKRGQMGWKQAIWLAVGFALVVSPWTIRNAVVFDEFIPVVTNGGVNFFAGSSRQFWVPPPEHHYQRRQRAQELIAMGEASPPPKNHSKSEGDRYSLQLGLANYRVMWRESTVDTLHFIGEKFWRLWYATQSGRHDRTIGWMNIPLLLGTCIGFVVLWRERRENRFAITVIGLTALYFIAILTALYPLARYVVGFTPLLALFCGAAVAQVFARVIDNDFSAAPHS